MRLCLIALFCIPFLGSCAAQHNHAEKTQIEYKVDSVLLAQEHDSIILCCPTTAADSHEKYLTVYAKFPEDEKILSYGITNDHGTEIFTPNKYQSMDFGSSLTGYVPLNRNVAGDYVFILETTKRKFIKNFTLKGEE